MARPNGQDLARVGAPGSLQSLGDTPPREQRMQHTSLEATAPATTIQHVMPQVSAPSKP